LRTERDKRENDERLAAKAQRKLDNLATESKLTDPEQLDRKRAVIEAAMARARERNRKPG
jgi:electron transport complex protein RnfB